MLEQILSASKTDGDLSTLLDRTREYAQIYLFAKKRQKGCDGLGEMTNLKDELKSAIDDLLDYCERRGYGLIVEGDYDVETLSEEIMRERDVVS